MAKAISRETMMVGIFAVLAALGTAGALRYYLNQEDVEPPTPPKVRKLRVLVAGTDLPADRIVSKDDVVAIPMTKQQFSKQFKGMESEDAIMSPRGIIGRRLKEPLKRGQPFWTTRFYLDGTGPSIAKKLQPGYRAIRIHVPNTREAAVQAGMLVDVMFRSHSYPAKAGGLGIPEKTLTLMRRLEVLEAEPPRTAQERVSKKQLLYTLAVPEDKADVFGIIAGRGQVWLVPTPAGEKGTADEEDEIVSNASTLAQLLGIKRKPPPPAPFVTAIYRRGKVHLNRFVNDKKLTENQTGRKAGQPEQTVPGVSAPSGGKRDDGASGEEERDDSRDDASTGNDDEVSTVAEKDSAAAYDQEEPAATEQEQ
jgi:Flp pilus assembly protein CpaB